MTPLALGSARGHGSVFRMRHDNDDDRRKWPLRRRTWTILALSAALWALLIWLALALF